ncbi:uncharacterized protein LY89DRAFT_728225 [Mollisia scopiformis]|uniref:Uncharacterized protein n=1 Tax=Mollisia scopiformis TaxID=149040 RepID=A0A194XT46_MOLSC|nr:uncharacterized protein LY89DRAFT_728225 [Mollisia scopiformis]KUJ23480.1 hypothetical protein LY89DRAFT_728225 [Mollisia scopiformis]
MPDPPQRYKLQLTDFWANEYRSKYNSEPKYHYKDVMFGLEDDEVVVAGILLGSDLVPHWQFRNLFQGDNRNMMDTSSNAKATVVGHLDGNLVFLIVLVPYKDSVSFQGPNFTGGQNSNEKMNK